LDFRRINPDLAEKGVQTKGAGLIGNYGNDLAANSFVAKQETDQTHKTHGGRDFELAGAFVEFGEIFRVRGIERFGRDDALRKKTTKLLPALQQIICFAALGRRTEEGGFGNFLIADGNV